MEHDAGINGEYDGVMVDLQTLAVLENETANGISFINRVIDNVSVACCIGIDFYSGSETVLSDRVRAGGEINADCVNTLRNLGFFDNATS